jgi:hypothetical protein
MYVHICTYTYTGIQHMVAVVYRDDRDSEQGENPSWKADTDKSAGTVSFIEYVDSLTYAFG